MTLNVDSGQPVPGPETYSPAPPAAQATTGTSGGARGRTLIQRAIEIGISLACLALALRGAHPADLLDALRNASLVWIAVFVGILLLALVLKTWRWQLLFYPEHRLPFNSLFSIIAVSYMVSNVLPGRVGELARVVLLPAEQPVGAARTLSTIVVERLLDLLSVILLLVVLLPFISLPADMARGAQIIGTVALTGAVVLVVVSFWKARLLALAHAVLRYIRFLDRPMVYNAIGQLIDGFAMLRSRIGLAVIALALLSWVAIVGCAWAAAQAFHISVPITATMFAVVLTSLSMLLPSTPGYIGVFQAAAKLALLPLGVAEPVAVTYAFGWWGINYLSLTVTGVIAMWLHGIRFSQIMSWRK